MRCKAGDLAVVVSAEIRCNLGIIVRIIAPHADAIRLTRDKETYVRSLIESAIGA